MDAPTLLNTEIFYIRFDEDRFEITVRTRREEPAFVKTLVVQHYVTNGYIWADSIAKIEADFNYEWDERIEITVRPYTEK